MGAVLCNVEPVNRTLHKKGPREPAQKGRKRSQNPVVDVSTEHDLVFGRWSVTYQREMVKCGKAKCSKWHGPYWYAYWTEGTRTRSLYIGKERRPAQQMLERRKRLRAVKAQP